MEVRDVRELRDFAYRLVHPGGGQRASKKGKGVQKQTSRQKRGLIPRNGA